MTKAETAAEVTGQQRYFVTYDNINKRLFSGCRKFKGRK